jgi:GNAT superfamily N-acetyltransferase
VVEQHIGEVRRVFADLELALLDSHGTLVAAGWAVPIRWDGGAAHLPGGYTDSLVRSLQDRERGEEANSLVVMAAQVHPAHRGRGVAGELLTAMRRLAAGRGWPHVIAPVRPTLKSRYPLTPIERFAAWKRPDGLSLDPWLRTHQRLGAKVVATAPRSQSMTGTVEQWEGWTGMALPDTGDYVIPDGLDILHVDRERDRGAYVEPNVWMEHEPLPR